MISVGPLSLWHFDIVTFRESSLGPKNFTSGSPDADSQIRGASSPSWQPLEKTLLKPLNFKWVTNEKPHDQLKGAFRE